MFAEQKASEVWDLLDECLRRRVMHGDDNKQLASDIKRNRVPAERSAHQAEEVHGEGRSHVLWGSKGLGQRRHLPDADPPGEARRDWNLRPAGETRRSGSTRRQLRRRASWDRTTGKLVYVYFESDLGEACYITDFIKLDECFQACDEKHHGRDPEVLHDGEG